MRRASIRRWPALLTVLATAGAGLWLGTAPSAATSAFNAYGNVACTMSGVQTSRPGVTNRATAGVVQVLKATLACTTGNTGHADVTVTSGRIVATSTAATLSCSTAALPQLT